MKTKMHAWVEELPAEITVCDADGRLTEMNAAAQALFSADGGSGLIGSDLLDCHSGLDRFTLVGMLAEPRPNAYLNEEKGRQTFFYQAPWYQDGHFAGLVELSFQVPGSIPHFKRDQKERQA